MAQTAVNQAVENLQARNIEPTIRVAAGAQTGQASEVAEVAVDELSVRVYGDVAVAVVGESFKMNVAGKPVARPMRSTLVWQRAGASWKIVSSHHTTIRPPLAAGSSIDR